MEKQRKESLEAVLQLCGNLGAEIRYHPEHRYFTAMVWTGWDTPCGMGEAFVLLLRPIQHTGLHGLSQVCKKGRLVPLAQERPFQNFI